MISCGTTETVTEGEEKIPAQSESTAEPETEAETERIYPEYTDTFDGADFNILYYDAVAACGWGNSIPCDIAVEELTGDALSDAVYYRNAAMEERYNIRFRTESITDRFGIINQNDGVYQLYQSAGQQFCTLNEEGIPQLSIESEQAVSVFQLVYDFLGNTDIFFNRQTQGVDTIGVCNMFANNQALFIMRQIQAAFELRNMEADFGIIPTPKVLEGQQDYYTSIGYTVTLSEAIPSVVKDLRMSAVVLDTMAAESYYSVNEALYEKILGGKIVRDETSRKNLDIILENRVYDPGCVYNFGNITNIMMEWQRGSDQVASVIASTKKAINKSIDKFVDALRNN